MKLESYDDMVRIRRFTRTLYRLGLLSKVQEVELDNGVNDYVYMMWKNNK